MKRKQHRSTYTLWDEMMASPVHPMPMAFRRHQLTRMHGGLRALEHEAFPIPDDWRVVSDAVNLMETLVAMGEVVDADGLLPDAVEALALAGQRHLEGQRLGLSGKGMHALRAVLEDYEQCLNELSARTMIAAHRKTEKRIREILAGRARQHDVSVTDLP